MVIGNFNKDDIRKILISFIDEMQKRNIKLNRYDLISYCMGYFGSINILIFDTINDLALSNIVER